MFELKFAKTYDFEVMIKNNLNHVIEDAFCTKDNIFCVADGITRELKNGKEFFYPETIEDAKYIIKNYPNPSGATKVAKLCSNNFVKYLSEFDEANINKEVLYNIVKKINNEIKNINLNSKHDLAQNDFLGCVAVGGIIKNNTLFAFSICDSRIRILDENFNTLFDSYNTSIIKFEYKPNLFCKLFRKNWNWSNLSYRKYTRKVFRNNYLRLLLHKNCYGSLDGDPRAMHFVNTYEIPLSNAKYILAHSDGCNDLLETKEDIKKVIENPEIIQNEKHEKTLLIYEKI